MVAGVIRVVTGVQARWSNWESFNSAGPDRQRIYFANHNSNLDAPVIWAALPAPLRRRTRPVAAEDYWNRGPMRRLLARRVFRCVLIPRHNLSAHHHPLQTIEPALDEGCSLILFPEGTRAIDDDAGIGEFKPGLWHLARRHPELELVPVHLENLNRILPKGEFIPVPLLGAVTFGEGLHVQENETKEQFLRRARAAIEALA